MTRPDHKAFPSESEAEEKLPVGLTKREYMATAIMAGFAACDAAELPYTTIVTAEIAVSWADALICALNKNPATS